MGQLENLPHARVLLWALGGLAPNPRTHRSRHGRHRPGHRLGSRLSRRRSLDQVTHLDWRSPPHLQEHSHLHRRRAVCSSLTLSPPTTSTTTLPSARTRDSRNCNERPRRRLVVTTARLARPPCPWTTTHGTATCLGTAACRRRVGTCHGWSTSCRGRASWPASSERRLLGDWFERRR